MEPKFDLLLAQKVKPHAIRKRENKEPVFKKERNIKRKSSNTPSSASIPTKKLFKKEYPKLPKEKLNISIEMDLLNYSPNGSLAEILKPGYAIVLD